MTRTDLDDELSRVLDELPPGSTAPQAYEALGDAGLFALHYPVEHGGRGGTMEEYAAVAEAIGNRELADEVHLVTVQGVGCTILWFGTDHQRERWLPGIAAGRTLASLMLSERGAGSDAAAITTEAHRTETGWSLSGKKSWLLHADWSGLGLCSARTSTHANRYRGITLFLVPLSAPGVSVSPLPRAIDEPYFEVSLDDVQLSDDDVLGLPDRGFAIVTAAAGFERAGFDYLTRGRVWLGAGQETLVAFPQLATERRWGEVVRLEQELAGARALALDTVRSAEDMTFDYVLSAYSKYACGEAAQAVARWIGEDVLPERVVASRPDLVARLRAGVLEAPELSISGNAVDLLLDTISFDQRLGEPSRGSLDEPGLGGGASQAAFALRTAAFDGPVSEGRIAELLGFDPVGPFADPDHVLLALACIAIGTGEQALALAWKRAGGRRVAGRPLLEMQSTGHRLARTAARLALAWANVSSVCRALDEGIGAGYRAPAAAASAADATFQVSYALVQTYGAAGTSDEAPVAAFAACHAAAAAVGPASELWRRAGRERAAGGARPW